MSKSRILSSPWRLDMALRAGVAATAFACAAWFTKNSPGLALDDAYIHLTFARNLSQGFGFSFNPTEFSLGFSSPLWVMLLSLCGYLGGDLVAWAGRLSIIFFSLSCALIFDLVRISVADPSRHDILSATDLKNQGPDGQARAKAFGVLAGLGLAACGNMLWLCGAGMEVMLFLFLGISSILLLRPQESHPVPGGIVLGLFVLTRPTGFCLWLIIAIYGLAARAGRKHIITALIISLGMAAPWFIFSLAKTGYLLPPTRAGKLASDLFNAGLSARGILNYTIDHIYYLWVTGKGIVLLALFGLMASVARLHLSGLKDRPLVSGAGQSDLGQRLFSGLSKIAGTYISPASLLALGAVIHFFMYALLFRSTRSCTPYHYLRYQVFFIPGTIAFSTYALARLPGVIKTGGSDNRRLYAGVVAAVFIVACFVVELSHLRPWQQLYARNVDQLQREHRAAANWARLTLPEDARIAGLDIGILGYYSDRYVIDLGGLIDPGIIPDLEDHRTGPYLVRKGATHYFAMVRHPSERISGVKADHDRLYRLEYLRRFDYPAYPRPVFIHSLGIEIHGIVRYKK